MKKVIVWTSLAALLVLAASWGLSGPTVRVADVRKAETLLLTRQPNTGSVYGYTLHVTGRIDGRATLSLMTKDSSHEVQAMQGAVDFRWGGEWYADTAEVRYEPRDVADGHLTIRYVFSTF